MREFVMEWMRSLACFYLLLSVMLHLVPQKKYEPYVRFFLGLLLIGLICTPIFGLFGKREEFLTDFRLRVESSIYRLDEEDAARMQMLYLKEGVSLFQEQEQQENPQEADIRGKS